MKSVTESLALIAEFAKSTDAYCVRWPEGYWGVGLCTGCDREVGAGHSEDCVVGRFVDAVLNVCD